MLCFLTTLLSLVLVTSFAFTPSFSAVSRHGRINFRSNLKMASDDDFMAALNLRMAEVRSRDTKCPLVVLDAMLPRQVMKIQVNNPLLMELVRCQMQNETPLFGMLGMAILNTGEKINLHTGVEVEIVEKPVFADGGVLLVLKAGRRFRIAGEVQDADQGWTEARVEYLDSSEEENAEVESGEDKMAVARAIMKAKELTAPNANMKDNLSLVDSWIELAKENERQSGQIDQLLEQLGQIPPADSPTERALWVGALINPLPAMGVAMEIRPALLTATSAERRVDIACDGILRSIRHMDKSAPMW